MATLKYSNLSKSTLGSSYTAGDATIAVASGEGAKFPSTGDFYVAFDDPPSFYLKCTARSSDTLTVGTTAVDGGTAVNMASGKKVTECWPVSAIDKFKTDILAAAGLVLVEQHTASTSAELDFTTGITSAYDDYLIKISNLTPDTAGASLYMEVSTDGGSSYDTGSNYDWLTFYYNGNSQGISASLIQFANSLLADANCPVCGEINIYGASLARYKHFQSSLGTYVANTSTPFNFLGSATYKSSTAVNAFRLRCSSGNIASGTVRLYGYMK